MMRVLAAEQKLEALKRKTHLDLTLDEIRIILGCFRAVEYQAELDNEPYLDAGALALKAKLESLYARLLKDTNGGAR